MEAAATAVMVHAVCCFGFLCWFWRLWSRRQTDESHTLLTRGKYLAGRISVHSTWKYDDAQYRSKIDCRLAKSSSSSSSSSYHILLVKISMMRLLVINHRIYFACSPSHLILIILQWASMSPARCIWSTYATTSCTNDSQNWNTTTTPLSQRYIEIRSFDSYSTVD